MEYLQHRGSWGQTLWRTLKTHTILVQIEEEKCAIRKLSFVTKLSVVRSVKDKSQRVWVFFLLKIPTGGLITSH
jgi:hypothetical protein